MVFFNQLTGDKKFTRLGKLVSADVRGPRPVELKTKLGQAHTEPVTPESSPRLQNSGSVIQYHPY